MQSLRENARILRRDRRKGVSLVIAMCASFLVFIFGFSVLFSVSSFPCPLYCAARKTS